MSDPMLDKHGIHAGHDVSGDVELTTGSVLEVEIAGWTITRTAAGSIFLSGPPHAPGITLLTGSCSPVDHLTLALAENALRARPEPIVAACDPDALLALRAVASVPLPEDTSPGFVPARRDSSATYGPIPNTAVRAARRALGRLAPAGEAG